MNSVPVYHLSPTGRAAIDVESARIRQELAARRAARDSRPQHGLDETAQTTSPLMATNEAMAAPAEPAAFHP
jgi:hypothetical protein